MRTRELIGSAVTAEGRPITLHREADGYVVRIDNQPLMGSRTHGSETDMAELALRDVRSSDARVLVGGLGMGYTLRAVLDRLAASGQVVVVELLPCVVDWNRGALGDLAGHPLGDPRVELIVGDVADCLASCDARFDAVLLDVDNGPEAFTASANSRLYSPAGLAAMRRALRPGGVLAVWSAFPSPRFERALQRAGFEASAATVRAHAGRGSRHTVFLARVPQR